MAHISGKLTKKSIEPLKAGRHSDGNGLYVVVDPSGAKRWLLRVVIKGARNAKGQPLRTDLSLGSCSLVSVQEAREKALDYRKLAKQGTHPTKEARRLIPTFREVAL